MKAKVVIISTKPRDIKANMVPARRVETNPITTPKKRPTTPPRRGSRLIGK